MAAVFRALSLSATLVLVACGGGGGGGTGALRPDTAVVTPTVVANIVTPSADSSVAAGQGLAIQSDAMALKAALAVHRWTIEQISGATVAPDKSPKILDPGCTTASVTVGAAPSGSSRGKDAVSICRTNIVVPADASASQWLVTNVAGTSSKTNSRQFVLRVTPVDARIGLSVSVPTVPQMVTTGQAAFITATSAVGAEVALDAPVTYEWSQVAGAQVPLAGSNTATMSFVPREEGDFAFKVIATASAGGRTDTAQATVVATAKAPGAAALGLAVLVPTVPQVFGLNSLASLTAAHSVAPGVVLDGPVTYAWSQVSGSAVSLAGADTPTVSFIPRTPEDFILKVRVSATSKGRTESKESLVVASVPETLAGQSFRVSAGDSQVVTPPTAVLLTGSIQAGAPAPGHLSYRWTQVGGPEVTITNPQTLSASFIAGVAGDYSFELAVTSSTTSRRALTTVKAVAAASAGGGSNAGAPPLDPEDRWVENYPVRMMVRLADDSAPASEPGFNSVATGSGRVSEVALSTALQAGGNGGDVMLLVGESRDTVLPYLDQYLVEAKKYPNIKWVYVFDELFLSSNGTIRIGENEPAVVNAARKAQAAGYKASVTILPQVILHPDFKLADMNQFDVIGIDMYPSGRPWDTRGCTYNDNYLTTTLYCSIKRLRELGYTKDIWYVYQAFGVRSDTEQDAGLRLQAKTVREAFTFGATGLVSYGYYDKGGSLPMESPNLYGGYGTSIEWLVDPLRMPN